ncbi:hypothetical protein FB451DRAFT_1177086 [Mycena latifolia]|nr:hypothetical protein FB451DRAFT_1177086 [Mycena latifolia]
MCTSMRLLKAFCAGGWRSERWREEAFAGCEGERQHRLRSFVGGVQEGGKGGIKGGSEGSCFVRHSASVGASVGGREGHCLGTFSRNVVHAALGLSCRLTMWSTNCGTDVRGAGSWT